MSLDGIVTSNIVYDLNKSLIGGRIDKIYQPEDEDLEITIYSKGENKKLLLSSNSSNPRIHFSSLKSTNPPVPPTFCMVLRKHIVGGKILDIRQLALDRVVSIDISTIDELALPIEKTLVIEIMGRHSNIILIDKASGKIIDSIKKVGFDMSRVRQVLPGIEYSYPPLDKLDPLNTSLEEFKKLFLDSEGKTFKVFYLNYMGLSPLISKEICFLSEIDPNSNPSKLTDDDLNKLYGTFDLFMDRIKNSDYSPSLMKEGGKYKSFYSFPIKQFQAEVLAKNSISETIEEYFLLNHRFDKISQKSQDLRKAIETKLDRTRSKLNKQEEEYRDSQNREIYKIYADLISSNIYRIEKGARSISLENYYSPNMETIEVPLDERYPAHENAQRYYKKYSKLKNASKLLTKQIPETKNEILYLENILNSIENSRDLDNLHDIKEELIESGYIKGKQRKKKSPNKSKPHHYISSEGYHIYVGKNNRQNDELSLKFAKKDDLWFHVQNMPGSHVLVRNDRNEFSQRLIEEAATLAAYYSKGKNSTSVAVDYTEKKNVKKPSGAKLGMVIYEDFKTIFVDPSEDLINKLEEITDL